MQHRTDWFCNAKWGVFFHYLASPASSTNAPEMTVDEWNRRIDGFDVKALAEELAEIGAGYFFITLGQNTGHFLSPNSTYDDLVRRTPSRLSRRDLVADLAAALAPHTIPLMVYLPSHAPAQDAAAVNGLRCLPPGDHSAWQLKPGTYTPDSPSGDRLAEFQRNWEAVIREWSLRWGKNVHGWWIDGCYFADQMYRHSDAPNFESFAGAMRAGNADSLVAFNPGVKIPVIKHASCEDYTAGEIANSIPVSVNTGTPSSWAPTLSRFVDGAQYHLLTFLGTYWGRGDVRFSDELLIAYTKYINSFGGVITWDVPPMLNGRIPDAFMRSLASLKRATR